MNIYSQVSPRPQNFRKEKNPGGNQAQTPHLQVSTCDSEMLGDLPGATQLVNGRAEIGTRSSNSSMVYGHLLLGLEEMMMMMTMAII